MANAYPNSSFIGFDNHKPSIEKAMKKAQEEGLKSDKLTFEVAKSTDFLGNKYDLVTFFDCLHDMGVLLTSASNLLPILSFPNSRELNRSLKANST